MGDPDNPDEWNERIADLWTAKPPVIAIAGPTASGKSSRAVELAKFLIDAGQDAAIINADSAQVYADLHILSARPDADEMCGVSHRLFGTWDGAVPCSAADWARAAKAVIAELHERRTVPILVGGTGLYLRVLLEGIAPVPAVDRDIRAAVRSMPLADARDALEQADPDAARRIAPADKTRTQRALEVAQSTGRSLAEWQQRKTGGIADGIALSAAVLLPDRDWLHARCDLRFETMLDAGAEAEVIALLARNLDPDLPVMRAIGVPQIARYLAGEIDRAEMVAAGQLATRQYAKRQYTWFRNQSPKPWQRITQLSFPSTSLFDIIFRKVG
ncbi:MAG: tRNA (adenosine(37)-N6)-dimethylallyltransferase MiaA [Parerythrobacter sp.]